MFPLQWVVLVWVPLAVSQPAPPNCCATKTVGGVDYTFVREDSAAISYSCLSPCVYERDDQPGTSFCFAQGDQQVVCGDSTEGEPCLENSADSSSSKTDNKEDWQTIDLGKKCDCWSKADSDKAAKVDKTNLEKYCASFAAASKKYNIPKEILMAVASRESRAGSLLGLGDNKPGYGDHNNGFGLMQVDIRYHPVANEKNIDNIDQGAGILADMLKKVKEKHPDWSEGWQLRGAVAAYNFGLKNVQTKSGIDVGTASTCKPCDGNYSWDTMQRARWLAFN